MHKYGYRFCIFRATFTDLSFLIGNNLRDDFKFLHTFNSDVAKFLKSSSGQVAMMQPEKFHSKYEKKSNILTITVSLVNFNGGGGGE